MDSLLSCINIHTVFDKQHNCRKSRSGGDRDLDTEPSEKRLQSTDLVWIDPSSDQTHDEVEWSFVEMNEGNRWNTDGKPDRHDHHHHHQVYDQLNEILLRPPPPPLSPTASVIAHIIDHLQQSIRRQYGPSILPAAMDIAISQSRVLTKPIVFLIVLKAIFKMYVRFAGIFVVFIMVTGFLFMTPIPGFLWTALRGAWSGAVSAVSTANYV